MIATERSALVLADEFARVERFVTPLRRSNLSVHRATRPAEAARLAFERPFDLVVCVLPLTGADRVVEAARAEASASHRAGIVVITGQEEAAGDQTACLRANRRLPATCSTEEFRQAAADLLRVAPRIGVPDQTRLRFKPAASAPRDLRVENLSPTGMLLAATDVLPVGTVFGFALDLPGVRGPIRGRAEVVRLGTPSEGGEHRLGVRFLALGGEAPALLRKLVEQAEANENVPARDSRPVQTPDFRAPLDPAPAPAADDGAVRPEELARCREELADLTPMLNEILELGLKRRLRVADWYVTGAELGLETLRSFSSILAAIFENRPLGSEAARRLADLVEVRRKLSIFGEPQQDVNTRVQIMLELRPALERLLRELSDTPAGGSGEARFRSSGLISQVVVEIKRLVGLRHGLENLLAQLIDLRSPRFLFARGARRRNAVTLYRDYRAVAAAIGADLDPNRVTSRSRLRAAIRTVEREQRALQRRLETIHRKAFSLQFRRQATGDLDADLLDPRLQQILGDTLAAGAEYLVRAYSAYRHALEITGTDPALLDRVERLGAILARAGEEGSEPATARPGVSLPQRSSS